MVRDGPPVGDYFFLYLIAVILTVVVVSNDLTVAVVSNDEERSVF